MEKCIDKMEKGVYYNTNRKYNTNKYDKQKRNDCTLKTNLATRSQVRGSQQMTKCKHSSLASLLPRKWAVTDANRLCEEAWEIKKSKGRHFRQEWERNSSRSSPQVSCKAGTKGRLWDWQHLIRTEAIKISLTGYITWRKEEPRWKNVCLLRLMKSDDYSVSLDQRHIRLSEYWMQN